MTENPTSRQLPVTRYDHGRAELAELLGDLPRYRVDQVWQGLYKDLVNPDEISTLPKNLREELRAALPAALRQDVRSVGDQGETIKWLWRLTDDALIETVLMHYQKRSTVCISSQVGCAMGCGFCATGQMGFDRHLTAGEMVEQVIRAQQEAGDRRVSNVVFMGMGEPLANFDRTWTAVERLHGDLGLSARHITVSTVGMVPGILRMAEEALPVNLAVSLHAANDDLRDELVPINQRWPLAELADACRVHFDRTGRRLSLEWALIADVNDQPVDAQQLASFARSLGAHINLIPLNPTPGWPSQGSSPEQVRKFAEHLTNLGANATIRRTRGTEIDAACGQLRSTRLERPRVAVDLPSRSDRQDSPPE
ncbi:MAG TPA: 23S rRNA (adenine(2503)-C(2))-methyltransferase RlmN [Acidimicrobiia bacterium]|nr:23S rRNA (adenine(2503)-C(2))-methyltransferase RlmN [Acidimicrobiia bacterium]HIL46229.1 23S rRNA (adenine(2503)-C(2))-methyltransferase RlmN [Acidimicrobiia bacterium]